MSLKRPNLHSGEYVTLLVFFVAFLIHSHLPNVITRSHCSLMNHNSSWIEFSLSFKFIYVVTSLSLILHLLLGLDCILTNDFLYIFSHTPFLFFLFLIGCVTFLGSKTRIRKTTLVS